MAIQTGTWRVRSYPGSFDDDGGTGITAGGRPVARQGR